MRIRDMLAFGAVLLLCLPGIGGGIALLLNSLGNRPVADWGIISSIAVAIAAIFSIPLVLIAILVCAFELFSRQIHPTVKLANVLLLGLGIVAAFVVSFRFPM